MTNIPLLLILLSGFYGYRYSSYGLEKAQITSTQRIHQCNLNHFTIKVKTIKMKRQQNPQRSCRPPERSCKVVKKHSCLEHTPSRSGTDDRSKNIFKTFCPCNPCSCDACPDILKLLNAPISNHGLGKNSKGFDAFDNLNFGSCPKSPDPKPASCSKTCTEVVRPKPIELDMINHEDDCTCELIARAIRADVHRYLSLVDRTPKPDPKPNSEDNPECIAQSVPKTKIKFSTPDSNLDSNSNPCQQPNCTK